MITFTFIVSRQLWKWFANANLMITFTIMCICTVTPHADAGVVLGGAVRGGTKALQKMTAQERLQDLHAATHDLEVTATGIIPHLQCTNL